MKKVLIILSTSFQLCFVQAQSFNSALELSLYNNGSFSASLDNGAVTAPSSSVRFEEVLPGNHYLQVNRMVYNPRYHSYRTIPVFAGHVNFPANTRMTAKVTANHRFQVMDMYANYSVPPSPYQPVPVFYPAPAYQIPVMGDAEFENFRAGVHAASFEDTRLSMIRSQINYTYFTSRQVSALMNEMWFESGRLEVAKMAYSKTIDKQNYYLVNDKFWFDSSIRDLNQYIAVL